jgi:hypothetical protein
MGSWLTVGNIRGAASDRVAGQFSHPPVAFVGVACVDFRLYYPSQEWGAGLKSVCFWTSVMSRILFCLKSESLF